MKIDELISTVDYPPISVESLQMALDRWGELLGPGHVTTDEDDLHVANAATFTPSGRVIAIIRPSSTAEVQSCLRTAQDLRIPVHIASRGRNWGYGSRTPPGGSVVLMELRRMNKVLEFSEELAYVRVQPGVTFQQLWEFLEERSPNFQIQATSGPPDGSVIGNTLERGRSHGPKRMAGRSVSDFEVVLPDGRIIHTSSRRFSGSAHGPSEPFPVGPDVTGLFFESNLGIVTAMTVWLTRTPRHVRFLRLCVPDHETLCRAVLPIRDLVMDGVLLPENVFCMNDYRWRADAVLHKQAEQDPISHLLGLPCWPEGDYTWLCTVAVHSSDLVVVDRWFELVKEALLPYSIASYEGTVTSLGARPDPEPMRILYAQKGMKAPAIPDLDRDRIGCIFIAPVAPALPDAIRDVYATMCERIHAYGFEPYINLRFWDARSVVFIGSIIYDPDLAGANARAVDCFKTLFDTLSRMGYLPYRIPTFAMEMLPDPVDDWGSFWRDIKGTLDPSDILSPGRYDFRPSWPDSDLR